MRPERGKGLPLRVLMLDGTAEDAARVAEALREGGWCAEIHRPALRDAAEPVERSAYDVVIGDAELRRDGGPGVSAVEQAIAARDEFLNLASHELKTPLTSMQLQLHSLARFIEAGGAGTEKVSARIRDLARSTERLGELVNRLLDVSQIASRGGVELVREDMDLADVVRDVVARFHESAAEVGSTLSATLDGPVRGWWDRMRLDAMLTNLVANAVKYGGGRPIEISLRHDADLARVDVRDHGIGIAREDQARIFGRFERAVAGRHYSGFGLGLWVARLVAEEHGGSIGVASEPGSGSVFTVRLPLRGARGGDRE